MPDTNLTIIILDECISLLLLHPFACRVFSSFCQSYNHFFLVEINKGNQLLKAFLKMFDGVLLIVKLET